VLICTVSQHTRNAKNDLMYVQCILGKWFFGGHFLVVNHPGRWRNIHKPYSRQLQMVMINNNKGLGTGCLHREHYDVLLIIVL